MAELPRGTVTFLFTDVERSTQRWERDAAAMRPAVERHFALLREAVAAHAGVVFRTIGDAIQAAFGTAPAALAAALEAQRLLEIEPWPAATGPLRVRMALHTGEAAPQDGDYLVVPALNRLARLMAAGHGGQVLLSAAVQQLARDTLPPSADLRDLGEHRLRDLLHPEHVYQLVVPDLPADFPPLKTLDRHRHNLPIQPTPFVGREREVATIQARLEHAAGRLLTCTGPPGVGKTRLALQAAADLVDAFDDVVFVSLETVRDPDLVVATIGQALGIRDEGPWVLLASLIERLRDRQALLILDNFEQVAAAAPLVAELLRTCPRLKVLATSRVRLHVRSEHEFVVPPLELPDLNRLPPVELLTENEAVRLFAERAQVLKPAFTITLENRRIVASICHRVDGLPLAIELAAGRIKILSPEAMLARLERRLPLLVGGGQDLPLRHRTMRAAIAWGYDLLDAGDQALFRRLGVFAGGCTVEAAQAVAVGGGPEFDVLGGLGSLTDKSLLRQEESLGGEPRFAMLETIREYALERLEASGEGANVRRHHAAYFRAQVEQGRLTLVGPEQRHWLDRLEVDLDNLRAALGWWLEQDKADPALRLGVTLTQFWLIRGYLSEGRAWLERLQARGAEAPPPLRAEVLQAAGILAMEQGNYRRAAQLYEQGMAALRRSGDKPGGIVGQLRRWKRPAPDQDLYAVCTFGLVVLSQPSIAASLLNSLGDLARNQGDYNRAVLLREQALALFREVGHKPGIAATVSNLGVAAHEQHGYGRAAMLFEEARTLYQQLGDTRGVARALNNLGAVAERRGERARAAALYESALTAWREIGDRPSLALALHNLGNVARAEGGIMRAAVLYGESLRLRRELGSKGAIAESFAGLGFVADGTAQPERAALLLGAAEALREAIDGGVPPIDRPTYAAAVATIRTKLGAGAFAAAWQAGRALLLEEAIAEAREVADELESTMLEPVAPKGAGKN